MATMREFIHEQPAAVERCLSATRAWAAAGLPDRFDGIVLVGAGSSFNALQAARPRFVAARRGAVVVLDPQDFVAELPALRGRPLVVVLSQSGASATAVAAARAAVAAGCPTIAITAVPGAPLAACGADLLPLAVGDEPVGPKTKGFTGSLATLHALAEALGAPATPPIDAVALASLIEPARAAAAALVPALATVDAIVVAGRRAPFGIALEASLKIAETAGIPTAAWPTEELLHGRLHGLTERSAVFLLAADDSEVTEAQRVQAVMQSRRVRVWVMDPAGAHWPPGWQLPPAPWHTLGLVLPFQWLAVLLAEACGLVPEAMRHGALSRELALKTVGGDEA